MNVDKVIAKLRDYDYVCEEAIVYLQNECYGKGYTFKKIIKKIVEDPNLSEQDKKNWVKIGRRLNSDETAIKLGIEIVETDTYRVVINGMKVKQDSLSGCNKFRNNYEWVKFINIIDGKIEPGDIDNFNRAETVMGNTYTTKEEIISLNVKIEHLIKDISNEYSIWKEVK